MTANIQTGAGNPPHALDESMTIGGPVKAKHASTDETSTMKKSWYLVSLLLLGLYLAYFYLLNGSSNNSVQIRFLGAGFSVAWLAVCFIAQSCFRNRFEFGIHTLLTLDFVLESLVDSHSGYGFYFCAASFWTVFLVYHHLPLFRKPK